MKSRPSFFLPASALLIAFTPLIFADEPIAPIARVLPPENGLPLPAELARTLGERIATFTDRIWEVDQNRHVGDVAALVKAVDFALKHGEFYSEKEFPLATELLDLADVSIGYK